MTDTDQGAGFEEGSEQESIQVNLTAVDSQGKFELLPRGNYPVEVELVEFTYSSKGNPMWTWTLIVTGGDFEGRKLWYHTVFQENTLPMVKAALEATGAPAELLESNFDPEIVAEEGTLEGLRAQARVDIKPYDGEKRNNVKRLMPAGEASFG